MSNILFLEKRLRTDKLGILYLSAVLKAGGHNVDLIQDDIDNAEQYLDTHQVDFICYSLMTSESQWYFRRNSELKAKYQFTSIFGGAHYVFYPEDGVDNADVDYIVRGAGEEAILDIVNGRIKNKVVIGKIPNLSNVPHPDRSILYKYDYFGKANIKRFIACRDCPHSCKFCGSKKYREVFKDQRCMFNQRVPVDTMIEEIKQVRDEYPPLKMVHFNDDDFAGNKKWLREFCEKYKEIGIPFGCEIRASSVDYWLLKEMKEAGCDSLFIGLESANPETLKLIGRTVSPEQVDDVCFWAHILGIKRVSIENMIGLPVEDPLQDALDTLEFNMKLHQKHSWIAIYQPFPQTELWDYCVKKGLLNPDESKFPLFEERSKLKIKDREKLYRLHKWWFTIIRHKLPMEIVKILLDIPLTEENAKMLWDYRLKKAKEEMYS